MNSSDIDTEYDAWLSEQSQLLRDRTFEKLDIENLIEELESLVFLTNLVPILKII